MAKPGPLDCWVDLESGFVRYGCGYSAPIIAMYTVDGEPTFDTDDAVIVVAKVPESHVIVPLYDVVDDEEERKQTLN